jgi:hypothetical protein
MYNRQTGLGQLLELTLFLDFLNFFVKMHLAISFVVVKKSYFLDLRSKVMGV